MSIKLRWIGPHAGDPPDLKIFHIEIIETEGCPPRAEILLKDQSNLHPLMNTCSFELYQHADLIFAGRVQSCTSHAPEVLKLRCQSEIQLPNLDPKVAPDFNPDPLDGGLDLNYWSRLTGVGSTCSIFASATTLDITDVVFADSIRTKPKSTSITQVDVTLKASWIQEKNAILDLGEAILDVCPDRKFTTLTAPSCQTAWWPRGLDLPNTCYRIADSALETTRTKIVTVGETKLQQAELKPTLDLQINYTQPREEMLTFSLKSKHNTGSARHLKIDLSGQLSGEVSPWEPETPYTTGFIVSHNGSYYRCVRGHSSRDQFLTDRAHWSAVSADQALKSKTTHHSFFESDRGTHLIQDAKKIALSHLVFALRDTYVEVEIPVHMATQMSVQDSVTFQDTAYKITKLQLIYDGARGTQVAKLTLATFSTDPSALHIPESLTASEIEGYREDQPIRLADVVEHLDVVNLSHEQRAAIEEAPDPAKALRALPTEIYMHLKPITIQGVLKRHLKLTGEDR